MLEYHAPAGVFQQVSIRQNVEAHDTSVLCLVFVPMLPLYFRSCCSGSLTNKPQLSLFAQSRNCPCYLNRSDLKLFLYHHIWMVLYLNHNKFLGRYCSSWFASFKWFWQLAMLEFGGLFVFISVWYYLICQWRVSLAHHFGLFGLAVAWFPFLLVNLDYQFGREAFSFVYFNFDIDFL